MGDAPAQQRLLPIQQRQQLHMHTLMRTTPMDLKIPVIAPYVKGVPAGKLAVKEETHAARWGLLRGYSSNATKWVDFVVTDSTRRESCHTLRVVRRSDCVKGKSWKSKGQAASVVKRATLWRLSARQNGASGALGGERPCRRRQLARRLGSTTGR